MTDIEKYVLSFFNRPGTFIEIGCWDGQHKSQTIQLEQAGWNGVCVDPFPVNFNNRRCQLVRCAISKDGLPREFTKVTIDRRDGGDVSYFSGFTDSIKDHLELIKTECNYSSVMVPTITFDTLCEENRVHDCNFLSVDTEGSELEIFESIDFSRYSFDMIMFEHNGVDKGVGRLLESKGYQLYKQLKLDDIYIKI